MHFSCHFYCTIEINKAYILKREKSLLSWAQNHALVGVISFLVNFDFWVLFTHSFLMTSCALSKFRYFMEWKHFLVSLGILDVFHNVLNLVKFCVNSLGGIVNCIFYFIEAFHHLFLLFKLTIKSSVRSKVRFSFRWRVPFFGWLDHLWFACLD